MDEVLTVPSIPHSREAEEALVGSVLIDENVLPEIMGIVVSEDFYIHKHGFIWDAILAIRNKREPIDYLTIQNELENRGVLAEIGGPAYITALINQVPTSLNAESYARIVQDHSTRRQAIQKANQIAQVAYDESKGIEEVVAEVAKADLEISQRAYRDNMLDAAQLASASFDRLAEIANEGFTPGLKTGLTDLDFCLGGLRKDEFILIAGRPGSGKTAALVKILREGASKNKHIALFSCEMSATQVHDRIMSAEAQIDGELIRDGRMDEETFQKYTDKIGHVEKWTYHVDDTARITPDEIMAKCTRLKAQGKLDLILVDYVQILGVPNWVHRYGNRVQEVSYLSGELKRIAKSLHVPVVTGAQVNRDVEKRAEPRLVLADLRETGALEQDADVVVFIQPNSDDEIKTESTPRKLTVAKNRNGKVSKGDIEVLFRDKYTDFVNMVHQ